MGGVLYGFTSFCIFLEGQTVLIGFPFALILSLVILIWGRKMLGQRPIRAFFLITYLLAALLFIGWVIYLVVSRNFLKSG